MKIHLAMIVLTGCLLGIRVAPAQESTAQPFEDKMLPALFQQEVQVELELVEDQKAELKQRLDALLQQKDELGRQLAEFQRSGATEQEVNARRQELIEGFELEKAETQSAILQVLLPHQRQRLREATAQIMMRESAKGRKVASPILVPEIRAYLEIDDQQAERIQQRASQLQSELMEQIRKLQQEAQAKLMAELTETQKAKYKQLVGDPIQR